MAVARVANNLKKLLALIPIVIVAVACSWMPNEHVTFVNHPEIIPVTDNLFEVNNKLKVQVDNRLFIVPKHFQTDLASIPRIFWPIESPLDYNNIAPAILHDYLYACPNGLSKLKIDSIFYSSLIDNGASPVVAYVFWLAVRVGGVSFFKKDNYCAVEDETSG